MSFDKKNQIYMQIMSADCDYIAARFLFMTGFSVTAARLANTILDSYAKIFLVSVGREDILDKIINKGGNRSHNVIKIFEHIQAENILAITLNEKEKITLKNFYDVYCMRYSDVFYHNQKLFADVGGEDLFVMDKFVSILRKAIVIDSQVMENTPIQIILAKKAKMFNAKEHEFLTRNNSYFR